MNKLISIGRFSRMTGLSVKALRFYDASGVLRPAVVDAETGYRYYRFLQITDAERVRALRELDVPLDEIEAVIHDSDPNAVHHCLNRHRVRLHEQIAERQSRLDALEVMQTDETLVRGYEVFARDEPGVHVLRLRYRTSLERTEADRARAVSALNTHLERGGGSAAGAPFLWYPARGVFDPDDYEVEVGLPTTTPVRGSDGVRTGHRAGGRVVLAVHQGSYQHVHRAYRAVELWMREAEQDKIGPIREVYTVGPWDVDDPALFRTEVVFPAEHGD